MLIGLGTIITGVLTIYPFLAVTQRVNTKMLVMEGWVHTFAAQGAMTELKNGGYDRIIVTGGPVRGNGGYTTDYDTSAHVGAGQLKALGVPASHVQMVPSHTLGRDRTYHSAVALREWLVAHEIKLASINVVTESVHARRTRLLFSEALGPAVKVGIIAVPDPDYDANHWWKYSEGVRDVIGEAIAYVYARLFFHPPPPAASPAGPANTATSNNPCRVRFTSEMVHANGLASSDFIAAADCMLSRTGRSSFALSQFKKHQPPT